MRPELSILFWPVVAIFLICVGLAVYWGLNWWADRQGGLVPLTPEQIARSKFLRRSWTSGEIHDIQAFGPAEVEKARRQAVILGFLKESHDGDHMYHIDAVDGVRKVDYVFGDPTDDMPHTVTGFTIPRSLATLDPRDQQAIEDLIVEEDLKQAGNEAELVDFNLYRRARAARKAHEESLPEEIWILPPGECTEEQIRAVGRIIDAEGEKS